jgi:alcohol dehydrogenase (cytochrome c)
MNKPRQVKPLFAAVGLTAILAGSALAQTAEELQNDHKTPGDVLVYGMGYAGCGPIRSRTIAVQRPSLSSGTV